MSKKCFRKINGFLSLGYKPVNIRALTSLVETTFYGTYYPSVFTHLSTDQDQLCLTYLIIIEETVFSDTIFIE